MTESNGNLGRMGTHFQEHFCYLLLINRKFADEMYEILDINYLELDYIKHITKEYFAYRTKYNTFPSVKIFRSLLKDQREINPVLYEKTQSFFSIKFNNGDNDFVTEKATDFCRIQKIKAALLDIVDLLKKPNIENSYSEIELAIKNALKFNSDKDVGVIYENESLFLQRMKPDNKRRIATGWGPIDELFKGGIPGGKLVTFLGVTGAGKSHLLVNLGANLVKRGETVVHYSLELQEDEICSRYDSNFSQISVDYLSDHQEKVWESIKGLPGRLVIKDFPTKSITIGALKSHYMKVKTVLGVDPSMILVDYADLIRPTKSSEKRLELEDIYEQLRGFAMEENIPIITVSQVSKSAIEDEIISIGKIAESFAKGMVADVVISLSRREADKVLNKGRLYVAKSRISYDGIVFPITMNTGTSTVEVFPSNS